MPELFAGRDCCAAAGLEAARAPAAGTKAGSYKYRLWLNEQMVGRGEVILRDK
ncbi:MAG TPA: hypothetical protein VKA02_07145 [Candidatus Acidoferrum sp.]|nr:hypothetical protein [Candidatus Acidoferrum sp.]